MFVAQRKIFVSFFGGGQLKECPVSQILAKSMLEKMATKLIETKKWPLNYKTVKEHFSNIENGKEGADGQK